MSVRLRIEHEVHLGIAIEETQMMMMMSSEGRENISSGVKKILNSLYIIN